MSDSLRDALEKLAEEWRYKGEFGWGPWQTGEGPDQEGTILDEASAELRKLLAAHPIEPAPVASRERVAEVLRSCWVDSKAGHHKLSTDSADGVAGVLLAAGVFREAQPECGAADRTGQRRCVFTPGHHEVEDWTSHGDRGGWTWNDQPAED